MSFSFVFPYQVAPEFKLPVAYFSMEFGIHQPLKTYAGGLGFLSGSHMRSAYELRQNIIGIGILWKYGYYDQVRKQDQTMDVLFQEKRYGFLIPTNIKFTIKVSKHDVWVTAFYLPPTIFNTAPVFFLTTDLPENDYLAKTISYKLYDSNPETTIAAAILLGVGGAKLLEALQWQPEVFHLNESHALPLIFYLYSHYKNVDTIKKKLVFTNHTPEASGNPKTSISLLDKMSFFCDIPITEILAITASDANVLNHTLTALRLCKIANAVSLMHQKTLQKIWQPEKNIAPIIAITNSQNFNYWHHQQMYEALQNNNHQQLQQIKKNEKKILFDLVADQCGEMYDENIFTIVFAKRFVGYKRADLFFHDMEKFHALVTNTKMPVQIIWAGKPYPMDYASIGVFDTIVDVCKKYNNCAILVGYELALSKILKNGADIWLNVPRLTHEASGTSGMSAAMNGAVNVGLPDGWFPEFAKDKMNAFVVPPSDSSLSIDLQDDIDANSLYQVLQTEVIPMYYNYPDRWIEIVKNSLKDIHPRFTSNRMATEYYQKMYLAI